MGITIGTGSGVSAWADQSGTGDLAKNAAQSTAAQQPTFSASDPAYNGRPSLSFATAATQYLVSGTWAAPFVTPETCFVVGNLDGLAVNETLCDGNASESRLIYNNGSATSLTTNPAISPITTTTSSPMIVCVVWDTSGSIRINAQTPQRTGDLSNAVARSFTLIGAAGGFIAPLQGKVVEHIIYNRALASAEISSIMTYLAARYAITLAA